jgi:hypothetical protein
MTQIKKIMALITCSLYCSFLNSIDAELVKTSPAFKKVYIQACEQLSNNQVTERMNFILKILTQGGTIVYYELVSKAIDDCLKALDKLSINKTQSDAKNLVKRLRIIKDEIDSDQTYDMKTGKVYTIETLRSGKSRIVETYYDPARCYKIAV